jgi:GrpB-like predicted nucleotidyltransferase (UPF0157 family)
MGSDEKDLQTRIERAIHEDVATVPYDPSWPELFEEEKEHLREILPADLIRRIEHFGSTAVPGLAAKPVIDMLVEVLSLDEVREIAVSLLEAQGYDFFWRPTHGDDGPPFYAWFIKRNSKGIRTHHIHMVEKDFEHWDGLLFRDYLICHPETALEYQILKMRLASRYPNDRVAYTDGKSEFIASVMERCLAQKNTVRHS